MLSTALGLGLGLGLGVGVGVGGDMGEIWGRYRAAAATISKLFS